MCHLASYVHMHCVVGVAVGGWMGGVQCELRCETCGIFHFSVILYIAHDSQSQNPLFL